MKTFKVVTSCRGGGKEVIITASEMDVFQGILNFLDQGRLIASFPVGQWHYAKEIH